MMKAISLLFFALFFTTQLKAYYPCSLIEVDLCLEISTKESLIESLAEEISKYEVYYDEAIAIALEYELKADEFWELYQITKNAAYADLSRQYDVKSADYRQLAYKYQKNIIPTLSRRLKATERELLSLIRKFDRIYL